MVEITESRFPRIGGRVWKTGVSVALSLAVCRAFRIPEPVFAAVAAVIVMQPTVLQTFRKGLERLQATVIGAAVALGMLALVTLYPLPYVRSVAAGAAVVIVLWLCLALKWLDALVLAAATVVVVMIQGEGRGDILTYAAERTLVTAVGIVVASLVNAFMFWHRVDDRFPRRLPEIASDTFDGFESTVRAFAQRDLPQARAIQERSNRQSRAFEQAASELTWFRETHAVAQIIPTRKTGPVSTLSEVYSILGSIRQSTGQLLEDTIKILEEHPDYVVEDAQVYHIIEDALKPASELSDAVTESLRTGDNISLRDTSRDWTQELHSQFIRSIRAAHRSPRDIFPLFEVAKVGVELRDYTRSLVRLRTLLLEDEDVSTVLGRHG